MKPMVKQFFRIAKLAAWMLLFAVPVGASSLNIPNSFTAGTTIQSALMNANFTSISSWANGNIDDTNLGAVGIQPLHVKCASIAQCTFGSAQTYIFNPNSVGIVPLNITNAAAPNGDYVDVTVNAGVAGGLFNVDKNGNTNIGQDAIFGASVVTSNTKVAIWNDNAGTNGMNLNIPTNSTNGFVFTVNGANQAQLDRTGSLFLQGSLTLQTGGQVCSNSLVCLVNDNAATKGIAFNVPSGSTNGWSFNVNGGRVAEITNAGSIQATETGQAQASYVPPVYTRTGGITANTTHAVVGTCTAVAGQCSITLTNAAVFASQTSYACSVAGTTASLGTDVIQTTQGSGSSLGFAAIKVTAGALATDSGYTDSFMYMCIGT